MKRPFHETLTPGVRVYHTNLKLAGTVVDSTGLASDSTSTIVSFDDGETKEVSTHFLELECQVCGETGGHANYCTQIK